MFGFIKKLIAGILGFITGLLPGKKGSGYYLELDESASDTPAATAKDEEVSPSPKANGTVAVVSAAVDVPTASKTTKVEPIKNGGANQATPTTVSGSNGTKTPATETTFAPKYLVPTASGSSRRRPGANMNSYLDMARQMKTSN